MIFQNAFAFYDDGLLCALENTKARRWNSFDSLLGYYRFPVKSISLIPITFYCVHLFFDLRQVFSFRSISFFPSFFFLSILFFFFLRADKTRVKMESIGTKERNERNLLRYRQRSKFNRDYRATYIIFSDRVKLDRVNREHI